MQNRAMKKKMLSILLTLHWKYWELNAWHFRYLILALNVSPLNTLKIPEIHSS